MYEIIKKITKPHDIVNIFIMYYNVFVILSKIGHMSLDFYIDPLLIFRDF